MRTLNWRKFKNSNVVHIEKLRKLDLYSYDDNGKLYDVMFHPELPALFWVTIWVLGADTPQRSISFGFNADGYIFGWPGKRLSSRPEHEYYFRDLIWLTDGDRQALFEAVIRPL